MKITSLLFLLSLTFMGLTTANSAEIKDHTTAIDTLFKKFDRTNGPGASVMVILDGKKVFTKSYGLADGEGKVCATPDSNYRLASVSKQFTAMAIMILADQGKLSFDDPITKFFPEFPEYGKSITVRHMLNHTSGLIDYEDIIPPGTTIPVLDINVLRLLKQQDKTYFSPGSQFKYSNTGFAFLALIVERVSGQTFASFLSENIFKPLRMDHTLAYEQGISAVSNRAYGYSPEKDGFRRTDQSLTSSVLGDGGIYSSVNDLYKWDQALYNLKLVSKKTFEAAYTPGKSTEHENGIRYGFGWFLSEYRGLKHIYHTGDSIGFRTIISRFPEQHFTVIVLSNEHDAELPSVANKIVDLYLFDNK
ncbi:serine hydrolase domain-containing protein [Pedosphaera parvula]|uniref:Beta-lactamase n=1 Tax=Pedosphaera parvula (strain Ellin514) TaxID=320771 RepID=B9XL39_PEDPL|nr:serine hydrolase domain-containing protein [Pedosphaera parvula]EEF59390.1 beta-lactamase [Pedosphaera parvula Ellin514]